MLKITWKGFVKCKHAWLGSYNKQADQLLKGKEKPLLINLVVDAMGHVFTHNLWYFDANECVTWYKIAK